MADNRWDAQKLFDMYLLDYMVKRNMHETAAHFRAETNVPLDQVALDTKEGFLHEWWTVFHDVLSSREHMHSGAQPPPMFNAETSHPRTEDDEVRRLQLSRVPLDSNGRYRLPKPTVVQLPGRGGAGGVPAAAGRMAIGTSYSLQYGKMLNGQQQQQQLNNAMRPPAGSMLSNGGIRLNPPTSRAAAVATSSSASPRDKQKQPVQNTILRPSIASDGREIRIGNSSSSNKMVDSGSNGAAASGSKGGEGFVSPDAGTSGGTIPMPPEGWLMKFLTDAEQFQPGFLSDKEQQGQEKKPGRRRPAPPAAAAAVGAGVGPSVDTIMIDLEDSNLQGNEMMTEKNGEEESKYQDQDDEMMQQDTGKDEVNKPDEDQFFQTFLCANDDENGLEEDIRLIEGQDEGQHPQATQHEVHEVNRLNMARKRMLCCHFSSKGELLVTSGHEKKIWIWNTVDFNYTRTSAGHSHHVTDIRFKPNSNMFATSSFDKTVQLWDADKPTMAPCKLEGHGERVLSLDFHPTLTHCLCSCDRNGEIRLWNVNQSRLVKISKGATAQVRFQPQSGKLLAMASGKTVSIVDSETHTVQFTLKDHVKEVRSICWDTTGKFIATVSEESARVWSLAGGGKCMRKLMSHGRDFHSCTFHPRFSQALLVGGQEKLVFWSVNQRWSTDGHKGIIAAMASSPAAGLIGSASHDGFVKLWK